MTNKNDQKNPTKVRIPCRLSFANLFEPKSINGSEPKYSVACLIDKNDKKTIAAVEAAVKLAFENGVASKWGGKKPGKPKMPIHDGEIDRPDDENYQNCIYINATSYDKPQVVDRRKNPIDDPMMVYSGCYCNVTVNFYPFDAGVNRGVAAGLGNVQFVRDGERLSGKASADEDFDVLEDDDDMGVLDEIPDYLK